MTRRTRRRLAVVAASASLGVTAPAWGPPLLSTVPAFRVERVEVVGARYVGEGEVVRLADVPTGASVWDDPSAWEAGVRRHPLVRDADIRRLGPRALEIRVREAEPVALVATPRLLAVDVEGSVLPISPTRHGLDLPILRAAPVGSPSATAGRETGGSARAGGAEARLLLDLLGSLGEHDPALVGRISELRASPGPGIELRLLEGSAAERIYLPVRDPMRALRRVEAALADAAERGIVTGTADARFRGQVVLEVREGA